MNIIPKPNVKMLLIPSMPFISVNTPMNIIAMEDIDPKKYNLTVNDTASKIKATTVMKNIKGTAILIFFYIQKLF